jgi:hypothetical protein
MNGHGIGIASFQKGIAVDHKGHVVEFENSSQLSVSCIWITDKNDDEIRTEFAGRLRFKSNQYFSRHLKTIVSDLGLGNLPTADRFKVLQAILSWCLEVSEHYGLLEDKESNRFYPNSVTTNRKKHLNIIITSASQRYCNLSVSNGNPLFVLYTPASLLFNNLKGTRYPLSGFRLNNYPPSKSELKQVDSNVAFVCVSDKVEILLIQNLPFLNMENRITQGVLWLSIPEYQLICNLLNMDVTVSSYLTSKSFTILKSITPAINKQKYIIGESAAYSIYLIYESYLGSLIGAGKKRMSFSEIYLSSVVRMEQLSLVIKLQKNGYSVQGYGGGRIALNNSPLKYTEYKKREFLTTIYEMGLLMPTVDFNVAPDLDKNQGTNAFATFFEYAHKGDSNSLCQLNHYILESSEQ